MAMSEAELVLCKWKKRLWPAQILSRNWTPRRCRNRKKLCSVRVNIISHNTQVTVPRASTEPLTEQSIQNIAAKLGRCGHFKSSRLTAEKTRSQRDGPTARSIVKELVYRRALREALDILNQRAASKETDPFRGEEPKPSAGKEMQEQPLAAQGQVSPQEQKSTEEVAGDPLAALMGSVRRPLRSATGDPSNYQSPSSSKEPAQEGHGILKARKLNGSAKRLKMQSQDDRKPHCFSTGTKEQLSSGLGSGEEASLSLPARTSTLTSAAHQDHSRLTPAEGKAGDATGLPRNLLGEVPPVPANPVLAVVELQKYQKASDGIMCSPRLATTAHSQQSTAESQPSLQRHSKRREDLETFLDRSPEGLKGEDSPDGPEGGGRHDWEGSKAGLEATSDLQLSPVRTVSLSPASRDDEEEEELPSILLHQEPCSFEAGMMVWYKLPRFPYWPAVVKKVNRKAKKASVLFIEKSMDAKKSKGFYTSLRKLKHFDCEEKQMLIDKAREKYYHDINWCINLIANYRIRVGCHSFAGSFLEYCADDMSYPVRKETLHNLSQMTFPQMEEVDIHESVSEVEVTPVKQAKKILPDRMRAARDRANEKIVEFIVKAKGADKHLRSILKSKKQSRWLKTFLRTPRYLILETYLEDDYQQDLVLNYLQEVYQEVGAQKLPLKNGDSAKFVLEVLFPEAIIYAISAVDQIDYKSAEEKYINGPSVSQREREQFEKEIQEKEKQHLPNHRLS